MLARVHACKRMQGRHEFNRGVNEVNRGVNEVNRGVNEVNRGVNHSVARQGCNLLRAAVTSAVTSQGWCCGNLQIHSLDLGRYGMWHLTSVAQALLCSVNSPISPQFCPYRLHRMQD